MHILHATRLVLIASVAAWLTAGLVSAQGGAPAPAPPASAPADTTPPPGAGVPPPRYDKATETTLKGPIQEVKVVTTPSGIRGTHLMLKDGKQVIEVFTGPTVFLEAQKFPLAKGDAVEVTGSRVTVNGTSALLARQVRKGDTVLILRDENGRPVWAAKKE
ncbi:MAG TPA: hypothetical protein VFE33_06005 [Thermoanaerobaculia bacterium]|nr:hypothetical protein [Thermoanaerobaculia bacterium]